MAAQKRAAGPAAAAAHHKKIQALTARLNRALKKIGNKALETEIRRTLAAMQKAHLGFYKSTIGAGWPE